jgi:hypothetical protein
MHAHQATGHPCQAQARGAACFEQHHLHLDLNLKKSPNNLAIFMKKLFSTIRTLDILNI